MAFTPEDIRKAAELVQRVKSIDDTIRWLGQDAPDSVKDHGAKVRDIFGRNRMSYFTDSQLGEVVLCAVINALLDRRAASVSGIQETVEFPEPPCPRQRPQEQNQ